MFSLYHAMKDKNMIPSASWEILDVASHLLFLFSLHVQTDLHSSYLNFRNVPLRVGESLQNVTGN